jgi:hypothetical protein
MAASLQASEDLILASSVLESERFGKSNWMRIAEEFWSDTSRTLYDSLTSVCAAESKCSTASSTVDAPITCPKLISSVADSPAKTSATPESEPESTASAADCGPSMRESFASFDHATSSWRTSQLCLDGEWSEFSETWPRAGMTRNGIAYQRVPLVPLIYESGFGYLPTPDASLAMDHVTVESESLICYRKEMGENRPSGSKIGSSLRWCPEFIREALRTGGKLNPEWIEVLQGYPLTWTALEDSATPSSRKLRNGSGEGS